ncbi:MAG TPA: amidohydrolase family protein, partial [Gemmatimonadaceae bacterium]|nr:amidohydrolase family protein [Gemmatimonadaceae bacterium]
MPGAAPPLPRLVLAAALLAAAAPGAGAQYAAVPDPAYYALKGVTVVAADGRRTSGVTIVVHDGLIEAMAPGAAVPAGARVLEGDSLTVYPGLVDAWGTAKFSFPEPEIDRSQLRSWDPPRAAQGFFPHRRVADVLTATGEDVADQRKKGVVAAVVLPEPALAAGRGALLMLRPEAGTPAELVVDDDVGTLLALRGGRGVYPATAFATSAFLRQALEDAKRDRIIETRYAEDPRGMPRPNVDPDYEVLEEIVAGDERVLFHADAMEDIRYAVSLGEQYGFKPVIVGGQDAWKVADLLKAKDVPVLVSLDFGTPRRWKPSAGDPARSTPDTADAAVRRERREFEERYANAGKLAAAGVRIALTSGGGKADLLAGARTAVRYGLSDSAALRALTTTPAELFGIPRTATLAVGGPATFVVTDGPLFGKDTRVRYTFVEGELERGASGAPRGAATKAGGAAAAIAGRWNVELTSTQGTLAGTMTLTGDASAFTGTIDTEMGAIQVRGGT